MAEHGPMLRLREIREGKGVSLRALKKASGVAVSSLAQFEAGKGDPQLSTLRRLAKALSVTVAELIGEQSIKKKGG
ncbi:MAG: helix-turn-helix transcriptional regulator [Nitrospirota bacterium]|nr:helix-turn-helix transcriptional regulator [Nitrospirota bacterium]MDP2384030.1 helix-turn-helix transcriptional regulator [Nitrospirota bacterium]